MSVNISSVGSDVLPPMGSGDASTVANTISIPPAISGPGGGTFILPCSVSPVCLDLHSMSGSYLFKSHPVVEWASAFFLSVELASCRVSVHQSRGFSATSTNPTLLPLYRYGLVPAGTVVTSNNGSICNYPRMVNYQLNMVGSSSTTQFGDGGLSFPPGVQLDFKPVQFRTNYISFLIGRATILPVTKKTIRDAKGNETGEKTVYDVDNVMNVIQVTLDFTIKVSAPGFGIPV